MMSKKVPELRFKGFTDDWEERKLGNYIIQYSEKTKQNNQYPVLTSSRNGLFFQKDYYKGNQIASEDNTGYNIVPRGYFTYRHMSDDLVFKFNINDIADYGIVSTLYPVFTTNEQLDSKYLQYQLNEGSEFKRFSLLQKQGGSRTYMYLNKLQNMILTIPKLEEQQKIGSFFKHLDDTIALYQRKLDLLKEQKKGFLQKIFPKNGSKVPELRFAGFADDWEERKLGEYVNFLNGRAYKQSELLDKGKYKVVRVGNFNTNDRWYYSDLELDQDKYAHKGDLLYLWATNFGPEIWSEEKVIYHYHIWKLELLNNNLDKQYLYTWLVTDKERIKQNTNGTTMVHVTKGNMEQRDFQFPGLNEQQKIGSFFKQLDKTIALHQRKLDLLKEQKKGFLQKMFV